jgi:hypothetical protein
MLVGSSHQTYAASGIKKPRSIEVDVRTFGAFGDKKTDDTAAFQHALTAAREFGGTVYAPPGQYLFIGSLVIPDGVALRGSFTCAFHRIQGYGLLGEGVERAIITANLFSGPAKIENASKGDIQIALNVASS